MTATPEAASLAQQIRDFIDDDEAVRVLEKYYSGAYTGALFDTAPELRSDDPDRFTAHDIAAAATLSVPVTGAAVKGLLEQSDTLAELLDVVPDVPLAEATDEDLDRLYALQDAVSDIDDIGHVTRSKLLAHKRPHLVPIRDKHVLTALVGDPVAIFTDPLRQALRADPGILSRLQEVQEEADRVGLSSLRALDVIVWMKAHGDQQVQSS